MRKKTRQRIIILLFVSLAIYLIVLNQIDRLNIIGGNWNIITNRLIDYFPQIIGILLGFYFTIRDIGHRQTTSARLFLIVSITGVFFSSLFYEMNNDGIWVDEIVTTSFTITDFQIVIVLFFVFLGLLIGLIRK